ncbi:MAG: glycosyltransferase family 2 protein [Azonexus sp.]|nr:glycosyltransferase family 2 protein [Azonexus sp.]
MISVVIPYFQRERGILARALQSVFASQDIDQLDVIVVDDASPIPAREEVEAIGSTCFPVTIIEQANRGPGGARNTGLDKVSRDTEYVAFLDSDDEWSPLHLKNALTALRVGYDVYFADHLQLGAETSAFRRANRIVPADHTPIAGQDNLYAYGGDMFDQIISGNVIGTPTVVFNKRKYPDVRFRNDLKMAGEDYLFWLGLALRGARFAFGSATEVVCGKGVNVFAGSGWGTENHARRIVDELAFRRLLLAEYPLLDHQKSNVVAGISSLRDALVRDFFHRLSERKNIDWRLIFSALRQEPWVISRVLPIVATKLLGKR